MTPSISAIMGEVDDFLGSDMDDSDTESLVSEGARTPHGVRKRKREGTADVESSDDGEGHAESRLQKRKKEALARTSSLTNVSTVPAGEATSAQDPGGGGLTAVNKIEIRNPTNIAVRVDDIPVEIYYKTEKVRYFPSRILESTLIVSLGNPDWKPQSTGRSYVVSSQDIRSLTQDGTIISLSSFIESQRGLSTFSRTFTPSSDHKIPEIQNARNSSRNTLPPTAC